MDTLPIIQALNKELETADAQKLLQLLGVARGICSIPGLAADIILRFRANQFEDYPDASTSRPASSLSPELQAALSTISREGPGLSGPLDRGDNQAPSSPVRNGPAVYGSPGAAGGETGPEVSPHMANRQRQLAPTFPRPTVADPSGTAGLPLRPGMNQPPPPRQAAVAGEQMIRCYGDQYVPIHTEDGKLLGCMPRFPEGVEKVYTIHLQELDVGWLALRTVVIPYNRGIDPFTIEGFIPAGGVRPGPLTTGPAGAGVNLDNQDIGRPV